MTDKELLFKLNELTEKAQAVGKLELGIYILRMITQGKTTAEIAIEVQHILDIESAFFEISSKKKVKIDD